MGPHALRGNVCRDAPRHKSAPRRMLKTGRRASRTACRRGASHDSRNPSRTSSLLRPSARIKSGLVYNDEYSAREREPGAGSTAVADTSIHQCVAYRARQAVADEGAVFAF
ncbi:DUF1534 domain-containing protein [Pseudomonas congelans]|nr:DUF1534 domain-containing protein [Pseudomonas congelans]